jgi:hypothetical protein
MYYDDVVGHARSRVTPNAVLLPRIGKQESFLLTGRLRQRYTPPEAKCTSPAQRHVPVRSRLFLFLILGNE